MYMEVGQGREARQKLHPPVTPCQKSQASTLHGLGQSQPLIHIGPAWAGTVTAPHCVWRGRAGVRGQAEAASSCDPVRGHRLPSSTGWDNRSPSPTGVLHGLGQLWPTLQVGVRGVLNTLGGGAGRGGKCGERIGLQMVDRDDGGDGSFTDDR